MDLREGTLGSPQPPAPKPWAENIVFGLFKPRRFNKTLLASARSIYLYDHPAGDKEIGGGERRPEEGSHHEGKHNAENKMEKHRFCA